MIRSSTLRACRVWAAASKKAILPITNTTSATINTNVKGLERFLHSATSQISSSNEDEDIKWRFPTDNWSKNLLRSVERGMNETIMLTFNSKSPITPDLMEEALVHLYWKVESLRICYRMRDEQLWVADMPKQKLDFQVASSTDLEKECSEIHKVKFDLYNGPLWNARLMPCPPDAPCPLPELKAAYPHQCHLLISVQHAANDGPTVFQLPELLTRIIDSLLEGSPVDTTPVGEFREGVEAKEEGNRIREGLVKDPEKLLSAIRKYLATKHFPLLTEAYGAPKEVNPTTIYLEPVHFDKQIIEKIAAKSRSNGASLNACLNAALNITVMEVAREGGLERDVYDISTRLPVSTRRVMKNCKGFPLGYHAIPFTHCVSTPHDVKKNFWQYVQRLHSEIREKVKKNYMCEELELEELLSTEGFMHETKISTEQLDCDHIYTNFNALEASQQRGIGKNVQITAEQNQFSFHNKNYAMAQGLLPFRGHLHLQNAYSTKAMDSRVANRCLEKNVSMLHDISKMVD